MKYLGTLGHESNIMNIDEECPICHSKRYLRHNMRFLVNPECYHKMCESCVDRIFSHGPAQCPVAGCQKTLRRNKFRQPTFADLQLEREIDIRRKIALVFNQEAEDFESLKDYNDYLNDVEDITFNLIQNIDVERTEKKLRDYEAQNKQAILDRTKQAKKEVQSAQARQAAERDEAHQKRLRALQDQQTLKMEKIAAERDILNKLALGGDATEIARQSEIAIRNNAKQRKKAMDEDFSSFDDSFQIRGLKKQVEVEEEKPYDPFGGLTDSRDYFLPQDDYGWNNFDALKESRYAAGGYDVREFYNRALCEAFGGLGIIIGES
jgi:CDK-activating kinase assembly factor MAT1